MKTQYKVMVDDNFHYMDESERYLSGIYATPEEAIQKCKIIVDEYLMSALKPDISVEELYRSYAGFGEDPWIDSGDGVNHFSAWEYASLRAKELTGDKI